MTLSQHANNEKAFVWSTICDFSEAEARPETFCIRFGSVENAQKFKKAFDEARQAAASIKHLYDGVKQLHLQQESGSSGDSSDSDEEQEKEEDASAPAAPEPLLEASKPCPSEDGASTDATARVAVVAAKDQDKEATDKEASCE